MILLSEVMKVVTHRNRKLNGGGNRELLFNGYSVSLIQDKKVLEMCSTTLHLRLTILPCTLKKTVKGTGLMFFGFFLTTTEGKLIKVLISQRQEAFKGEGSVVTL